MSVIIQYKRGTASQWTSLNPTLAAGEVGWESDTNKFKIGTGSTAWNSLAYATLTPSELTSGYARLAFPNTFSVGGHIINNDAVGTIPLQINRIVGQTADLFQVVGNSGTFQITSSGALRSNINVGNSFGGGTSANNILAVRANVATNVPLIISGAASQSADLLQIQDISGNNNLSVSSTYGLVGRNAGTVSFALSSANGLGAFYSTAATNVPMTLRGAASQSADLLQAQSSAGTVLAKIDKNGSFSGNYFGPSGAGLLGYLDWTTNTPIFNTGGTGVIGLVVKGVASQSANLQEWQTNTGSIASRISASGQFVSDQQTYIGSGATSISNARFNVASGSASVIGAVIRGATSQSSDLLQIQNSTPQTMSKIDSLGRHFIPGGTTIYDYAVESAGLTDTDWKKLIEVNCASGLYTGASYQVDVVDNFDNYGIAGNANVPQTFKFYVKITRSMGTQDDVLAAVVLGPSVNYVRVVKTSSALYEIQVRQPDIYRVVSYKVRRITQNNTTESYNPSGKSYGSLDAGSTTGTVYVPLNSSATFSNFVVENFSHLDSNKLTVEPLSDGIGVVPVTIRGVSGQTADLLQIQNSSSTNLINVTSAGNLNATGQIRVGTTSGLGQLAVVSTGSATIGAVIRGASGQTADLLQLQNATPSTLAVFDSSGRLNSTTAGNFGGLPAGLGFLGVQTSANTWGLVVRGGALQVNHLAVYQNSGGTTLGGVNANSQIFSGSAQPLTTSTGGATTATSGTGTVATITTTSNHNLASGDRVTISGITPAGYNGTYIVTGTPTTTSFTYNNATTGAQTVAGTVVVDSQVSATARSAATVGLLIRSAASQVANPFEVQNSSGTVIANVSSSGGVRATGTLQGATLSAVSDGSTVATLSSSGNIQFRGAASYGGGVGVIGIANATTAPSTSPTGGGILFVNSGALQYRGTSGANATLVNADGTTPYLGLGASYFAGHNPEGRLMYNAYLTNDMANARLRGSAVSATQNGSPYSISNANWDAMFDGTATFFNISPTSGFTFPLVITVPLPRTLTYGAYVGLSFGSTTFRANSVTIEVFSLDSSSWVTIFTTTTNTSEDIFAAVSGLVNGNATGINQVRYTISSPNSTQLRLQHLWAYNFNSDMWSQTMMPRGGGSFYAPISVTTVSDAVVMSVRGAASGGASIQTQDLQQWQTWNGTTTTTRARIDSGGNLKATNVATLNSIAQIAEANSGGLLVMGRATAQTSSPGLNTGTLYFRDGTTSGTLRLATRTGASGIEETIVDNLSSTGSTAGAQFTGAGGVRTAGILNANSSQYGNTILFAAPASTTYYLLATLPTSSAGTYDHLVIDAVAGGWGNADFSTYKVTFANRNAFSYKYELSNRNVMANFKLRAYSQVDGSVQIWASGEASAFLKFAYNISSAQNVTTVANPVSTTTAPSGTVVFDSSNVATYPPVQSIYGGISLFGTATGTVPMLVQGVSGQTADLVKIQNNTPIDLFTISSAGLITAKVVSNAANQSRGIMLSNTSDLWQSGLYLKSDGSGNPRLTLLAPTGALGEAISIDSAAKVGFNNINPTGQVDITTASTTRVPLIIRPQSSQTADLLQIRNSADNANLFRVTSSGDASLGALALGSGTIYGSSSWLNIVNSAASQIGIIVRGASGQSVNLTEWQTSTPTTVASVSPSGAFTASGDISTSAILKSNQSSGDEGGQIDLAKSVTNTTLTTGVSIDVYQNKLRFFETGGTNRGYYIDISTGGASAATNLVGGGGSFTGGTLTSDLVLAAGSTTVEPLTFQSNSSTPTTTSGAMDYDGTVFYQTANTNPGRALNTQNYYYASSSDYAPDFSTSASVQSMLGAATRGITVAAGTTYEYEFYATVQHTYVTNSGVTGTYQITSTTVSGSPTVAVVHQIDYGSNTTNFTTATTLSTIRTTTSVVFSAAISSGSRYNFLRAKGVIRVTGTGTTKIYPGLSLSGVAGDNIWNIQNGLVFKLTPIGNGTVTTVGAWA